MLSWRLSVLEAVLQMRALVSRGLWWDQVAALSCDEDGDVQIDEVLAVAAFTVTDIHTAFEISAAVNEAVHAATNQAILYNGPQELTLALLNHVIATRTKVN